MYEAGALLAEYKENVVITIVRFVHSQVISASLASLCCSSKAGRSSRER